MSVLSRNDNYGGDWASYNFTALQQWIQSFSVSELCCKTHYEAVLVQSESNCVISIHTSFMRINLSSVNGVNVDYSFLFSTAQKLFKN